MTHSTGAPAPHPFDNEAFDALAVLAAKADTAFDLNAIDRGFERLIKHPNRKTTGKTLAGRLARDGRKFLKAHRRREFLSDSIEADDCHADPPTNMELTDVQWAVTVIRTGLMRLNYRDRLALATKTNAGPADELAVKPRQFRNLVADARARLWAQPGVELAAQVVMDALGRWRFETIEMLFPLLMCMHETV